MGIGVFIFVEVILLVLLFWVNNPAKTRYRQGSIVILSIAVYILFSFFYLDYKEIIYFEWLEKLKNLPMFLGLQSEWNTFIESLQLRFAVDIGNYLTLIVTLLTIALFVVVKFVLLSAQWFGAFFTNGTGMPLLAMPWFQQTEDKIVVKSKYIFFGKVSRLFGLLLFISSLCVLALIDTEIIWPAYLPIPALIFLEIGFFLDNTEKEKHKIKVFVEDLSSSIVSKFDLLFRLYKETFDEKLLVESKQDLTFKGVKSSYQVKDQYLKSIYDDLKANKIKVSDDYFKGLDDLISSSYQNILFSNAFDMNYGLYLNVLFDHAYLHNQRVLVLVLDDVEKERTLLWVDGLIGSEVYDMCDSDTFKQNQRSHHVLVETIEKLLHSHTLHEYLKEFYYAVVLDMKNFIRKNHLYLNAFLNTYKSYAGDYPKIIGFSNLSNELEASFNNIFIIDSDETSEIKVHHNTIDQLYTLVFKSEGGKTFQEFIGLNGGHFIGNEVPLAYFAWSQGIKPIVVSSDISSIKEEMEALEGSVPQSTFFNSDILKISKRFFHPVSDKNKLFIVDDTGNLHQTITKWKNYAVANEVMLVVVSSYYLLRDYLAENFEITLKSAEWFKEIFPKGQPDHQEMAYLLLAKLSSSPVSRDEIRLYDSGSVNRNSIAKYLNEFSGLKIEPSAISVTQKKSFDKDLYYYSIPYNKYSPNLFYYTFINSHNKSLGICLEDDIYHKYLEGMRIVRNGMVYKILEIDEINRVIRMESKRTVQISKYDIRKHFVISKIDTKKSTLIKNRQIGSVKYKAEFIDINYTCQIIDYSERCNLKETYFVENRVIEYKKKKSLRIHYTLTESMISDKMRLTVEFMLNGVFQTIFPDMHHLLSVRVLTEKKRDSFVMESDHSPQSSKEMTIYIFETSRQDCHLLSTIIEETYYQRILMIVQDLIAWSRESGNPISPITKYDVVEEMDFDALSEFIDLLLLHKNDITNLRLGQTTVETSQEVTPICDFCAEPLPSGQFEKLSDGRERCERCKNSSVEYLGHSWNDLVDDAIRYLEDRYGIKIDQRLSVQIVNSDTLMNVRGADEPFQPTPGFDVRAVGLAVDAADDHKTIYIENAAPKFRAMSVIVHELTHIWQFHNLDFGKMDNDKVKIEGQAQWVELTYVEETYPAEKKFLEWEKARTDEYGQGYQYVERVLKNRVSTGLVERFFSSGGKGNPFEAYRDMFGK